MPVKKKKAGAKKVAAAKKATKKPVKKTSKKATEKTAKPPMASQPAPALKGYECEICGYRLIVDKDCGCAEEHVILCCGQPMKQFGQGA